jgi:hypothetical protein
VLLLDTEQQQDLAQLGRIVLIDKVLWIMEPRKYSRQSASFSFTIEVIEPSPSLAVATSDEPIHSMAPTI